MMTGLTLAVEYQLYFSCTTKRYSETTQNLNPLSNIRTDLYYLSRICIVFWGGIHFITVSSIVHINVL